VTSPWTPSAGGGPPIGVSLGPIGVDARWWLESAVRLDAAGYAGLWCWDHFVSRGDRRTPVLEAWTILTAAAAQTRGIRIGSFVLNVMNRHPAVLARMAATLQEVAGGRLVLGIGTGGHPAEHHAYGIPFPPIDERAARLEEAVGVIRALWSGGPVDRAGHFYPLADAHAFPRPSPVPPILIGARTPAGIRIAARIGDGWAAESDVFEELEPRYREALAGAGRERAEQRIVVGFPGGRAGRDALRNSPWVEAPRETLAGWRARGADEVIVTARTTADVNALVDATSRW
jgi:alkanesulfonate monooxygenase SsuD/methylene tetrahydromethanopterin reductase-like flavin-dependent oxidoreductase (luciferase family)